MNGHPHPGQAPETVMLLKKAGKKCRLLFLSLALLSCKLSPFEEKITKTVKMDENWLLLSSLKPEDYAKNY